MRIYTTSLKILYNLNNFLCMNEKNDVVSYVPVDATMEDGCLVIGVQEIGL